MNQSNTETILHHLLRRRESDANHHAVQFKDQERWVRYTWSEYAQIIESLAAALLDRGLEAGERVAIMADTRPEWIIADLAIMGVGGVTVPVYPNNLDEDVEFILQNSDVKILILEDANQIEKWRNIQARCPSVKTIIVIERTEKTEKLNAGPSLLNWSDALTLGRERLRTEPRAFIERAKATQLDDMATIVYTSGTTGRPKGVVLNHEQVMSEVIDIFNIIAVNGDDTTLTFLPYSHIFGRVEAWGHIYSGYMLAFAESIEKIRANLSEVKPTFMVAVPRIFEKIYGGILAQVENSKTKKQIFDRAFKIGQKVSEALQKQERLSLALMIEHKIVDALVFKKIRDGLGGRLRFVVSGGAPLSPDITRFFHGLGLLICEGYGLTETTAGITFNTPLAYKIGTTGRPVGDVQIRIAEDGEILVQSKKVMKCYYKNVEATNEVMTKDNFFKTGDIGHVDEDGYLKITDRKKDLIKTAGGKYVAPQKLEGLLKLNPYVSNVLIHGDQKKYIVALLTLNMGMIKKLVSNSSESPEAMVKESKVQLLIKEAVAEANSQLASFESVKKFAILPYDFTIETGELTPSLKVKRKFCDQKYHAQIESLYS